MTFLLDVNILIALIDPTHVNHESAHIWFGREGRESWTTCPITENGVIRIVGHPGYPNTPGPPGVVAGMARQFQKHPGHVFWVDKISLLDPALVEAADILTTHRVTDSYLLAPAVAYHGKLGTFDRRLSTKAVVGGKAALHLIGAPRS